MENKENNATVTEEKIFAYLALQHGRIDYYKSKNYADNSLEVRHAYDLYFACFDMAEALLGRKPKYNADTGKYV